MPDCLIILIIYNINMLNLYLIGRKDGKRHRRTWFLLLLRNYFPVRREFCREGRARLNDLKKFIQWLRNGMDIRFAPYNLHLESPDHFTSHDPHLKDLSRHALVWNFSLIHRLPVKMSGVYTVGGGRHVGKTVLIKQWMAHLSLVFLTFPGIRYIFFDIHQP